MANSWGADVFVSIHANAHSDPNVRGTESIYPSNHHVSSSFDLANYIHGYLTNRYPSSPRGVYQDSVGFCVLNYTQMPAVIVELLSMTNSEDLALLKSASERDWMAYYIYRGIKDWWCGGEACTWE